MTISKEKIKFIFNNICPFSDECWLELIDSFKVIEIDKNESFSKEGETFKYFGLVQSGILRAYHSNDTGTEWNEYFFSENDFITSGVSPETQNITNIQSLTKSNILIIPFSKLMELSSKYPEISLFFQKLSFKCLENRQKRELMLQSKDAMNKYLLFKQTFFDIESQIQDFHIASYIGVTPTQLSRIKKSIMQLHM